MTAQLLAKKRYFSPLELSRVNWDNIPKHIAMIPDGNRRWATQQQLSTTNGHEEGGNTLIEIVKSACELNIETMTFYLFSTENWGRPELEIAALMWLLHTFLIDNLPEMLEYGIRLHTIGSLEKLPEYVQETISETKIATEGCQRIDMVFALNYGSRDEICRAVRSIAQDVKNGKITPESIDEAFITSRLDTAPWKDPDLLIRTSGEMRLSNYLLWQLSYSEIHVTDVLWPNFQPKNLLEALLSYQTRQRRLGKQ